MAKAKDETKTKEKVELTPEQKAEAAEKRMQEDLRMVHIAERQKDEEAQNLILSRLRGKFSKEFLDKAVENGEIKQKTADWLKEQGKIGKGRTGGGGGKSVARPWRWQVDAKEDSPTGEALKKLEDDLTVLEKKHKDNGNFATISKFFKDNDGVEKKFNTYFAKVKEKEENGKGKSNGKK